MCLTKITTRKQEVSTAVTKKKNWNKWKQDRSYRLFELGEVKSLRGPNLGQLSKST